MELEKYSLLEGNSMILVCGGAGYIGSHAVRQLIDKGEEDI